MASITIDGTSYDVADGQNLLQAALSLKLNLPFFCWHPAMGSVGACRQCAVKVFRDEKDTRGRIVMACMTAANNGLHASINDPEARDFRATVIEWLMENHPHDCPVCDEGGECHLQDMTVMTGHVYRRYRFKKRTHRNQNIGPFVTHEMNRCIQCYRCVRFYNDYAGGDDLRVFDAHDNVYFGRDTDGALESEFSGNLVEVCPTGVFTDKTLASHYTRKWDFSQAPSVCVNCGLGCNTLPGERYGELRRIRNRYNKEVNGHFLCDRGRYGYEFVNSQARLRQPAYHPRQAESAAVATPSGNAFLRVPELLKGRIIGIGSPRASLENNFALRKLVGAGNFYSGLSRRDSRLVQAILDVLRKGPAPSASLEDARNADAVLILGEDVTQYNPVLGLAIRQAARQQPLKLADELKIPRWDDYPVRELTQGMHGPIFIATPTATKLDDIATATLRAAPDDIARLGFAIANGLGAAGQPVQGLAAQTQAMVSAAVAALGAAERPLVVAGMGAGSEHTIRAAAHVAWALQARGLPVHIAFTVPECNTLGVGLLGGRSLEEAERALRNGEAQSMLILENDLYQRLDADAVDTLLAAAPSVVAIDHLANDTVTRADAVLPAATFAEADGAYVNNEGRAQRFYQVMAAGFEIKESWRWLRDIMIVLGRGAEATWQNLDDVTQELAATLPAFAPVAEIAPPAGFRIAGLKIARQHARASGRTAIAARVNVKEQRPPQDSDAPFNFSMEGYHGSTPAALLPRFWAPGWNSIQSLHRFQEEVNGPLNGGTPGQRLLEVGEGARASYDSVVPEAFARRQDEWLVLPIYHLFGSEELSVRTPGVAQLMPKPYLALNPHDAQRLGMSAGDEQTLRLGGRLRSVTIRIVPELAEGVAGLPAGLPGLEGVVLPTWSALT